MSAKPDFQAIIPIVPETAAQLAASTEQLGVYLAQMAQIMAAMQRRLDEMEETRRQVTANHEEVKQLGVLIRLRAAEYCEKYELDGPKDAAAVRAAIKRGVLKRYGIKDLHDCPQIALGAIQKQVDRWADIRLVMKLRDKHREDA